MTQFASAQLRTTNKQLNPTGLTVDAIPWTLPAEMFGAFPGASGAINTAAINTALGFGGAVSILTPGQFDLDCSTRFNSPLATTTYNVALLPSSGNKLIVGNNTTLKLTGGWQNPCMIRPKDISGTASNISIEGGIWDSNFTAQTRADGTNDFCCAAMWLQGISKLRLKNIELRTPMAWGIAIANCTDIYADDTRFNYSGGAFNVGNRGGFQFEGPNSNIFVNNTKGNTYDDMIAFVAQEVAGTVAANAMAGPGPITNINVNGVIGDTTLGALQFVRLQDSTANPILNVNISNLSGAYVESCVVMGISGLTSSLRNINIDGMAISQFGNTGTRATLAVDGAIDSLHVKNVSRTIAVSEVPRPLLRFNTTSSSNTVELDGVSLLDLGNTAGAIAWINTQGSHTLTSLQLNNSSFRYNGAGSAVDNLISVTSGTIANVQINNLIALKIGALVTYNGNGGLCALNNVYSDNNNAPIISTTAAITLPHILLNNVRLGGTQGGASGVINFNGLSGTCSIQAQNCVAGNGANPSIVRAGAEAIRYNGICPQFPVASNILTAALGDCLSDSTAANAPVRCSTAGAPGVAVFTGL